MTSISPLGVFGVDRTASHERAGQPAVETSRSSDAGAPSFDPLGTVASTGPARFSRPSRTSPLVEFEAFVMRSFIDTMLPKAESGYFGQGTAGEMWRSQMAEQIGNEIAAAGGIGIADMLEGHGPAQRADGAVEAIARGEARMADELNAASVIGGPVEGQGE